MVTFDGIPLTGYGTLINPRPKHFYIKDHIESAKQLIYNDINNRRSFSLNLTSIGKFNGKQRQIKF